MNLFDMAARDARQEGMQQGMQEGIREGSVRIAQVLLKENMDAEFVQRVTGLSQADIAAIED